MYIFAITLESCMSKARPGPSSSSIAFLSCAAAVVLLHIWGAFDGSQNSWGTHLFAFYPGVVGLAALAAAIALFLPRTQTLILSIFDRVAKAFAKLPVVAGFAVATLAVVGGAFLVPSKLHLLGDGALLIRSIPRSVWGDEVVQSFKNQPLLDVLYRWAVNFHPADQPPNPNEVYFLIDVIAAVLFMILLFWAITKLQRPPVEQLLLGLLLFAGAGSQFFFGYVENYVLQYVATAAYVVTGWLALDKRVHIAAPLVCFALLPGLNLGTLIFAPSLVYLLFLRFHEKKLIVLFAMIASGIAGICGLFAIGFDFRSFLRHLTSGSVDFLQPFSDVGGNFPYGMFSLLHVLDWGNALLLIAPFGLIVPAIVLHYMPADRRWKNSALIFLLVAAACGLLFTWIINSALGMARDWDMLSSFYVPLMVLSVYLLAHPLMTEPRRPVILLVTGLSLIHLAAFVGINADSDRHLKRFRALNSTKLYSLVAQMSYSEALANYYYDGKDYAEAKRYYATYMKIDSMNPRIIANITDVYRKMGEKEHYFESLKRAASLNNPNPGIYSNLGVEYAGRGDTANAILFNERAIALEPTQQKAHANLGILYMSKKEYETADLHFQSAIGLGMRDAVLFRYAGDVAVVLEQYDRALHDYDLCLELAPDNARVRSVRERIRLMLQQRSIKK